MKPELSAPGRYMIGAGPARLDARLRAARRASTAPGYMQLSGTSFAAPVVSGTAADILARHPDLTPDQVKGALMLTARPLDTSRRARRRRRRGHGRQGDRRRRTRRTRTPASSRFVDDGPARSGSVFDAASWNSAAQANALLELGLLEQRLLELGSASWNSASWNSASWNSASWNSRLLEQRLLELGLLELELPRGRGRPGRAPLSTQPTGRTTDRRR